MNVDVNILNKILASQIQQCLWKLVQPEQVVSFPGVPWWLNMCKSINTMYQIHRSKGQEFHKHLNKCRKKLHSTSLHHKSPEETRINSSYLSTTKAISDRPIANKHYTKWEKLNLFTLKSGMRQGCPLSLLFSIVLKS
jgi:hypothetical protein